MPNSRVISNVGSAPTLSRRVVLRPNTINFVTCRSLDKQEKLIKEIGLAGVKLEELKTNWGGSGRESIDRELIDLADLARASHQAEADLFYRAQVMGCKIVQVGLAEAAILNQEQVEKYGFLSRAYEWLEAKGIKSGSRCYWSRLEEYKTDRPEIFGQILTEAAALNGLAHPIFLTEPNFKRRYAETGRALGGLYIFLYQRLGSKKQKIIDSALSLAGIHGQDIPAEVWFEEIRKMTYVNCSKIPAWIQTVLLTILRDMDEVEYIDQVGKTATKKRLARSSQLMGDHLNRVIIPQIGRALNFMYKYYLRHPEREGKLIIEFMLEKLEIKEGEPDDQARLTPPKKTTEIRAENGLKEKSVIECPPREREVKPKNIIDIKIPFEIQRDLVMMLSEQAAEFTDSNGRHWVKKPLAHPLFLLSDHFREIPLPQTGKTMMGFYSFWETHPQRNGRNVLDFMLFNLGFSRRDISEEVWFEEMTNMEVIDWSRSPWRIHLRALELLLAETGKASLLDLRKSDFGKKIPRLGRDLESLVSYWEDFVRQKGLLTDSWEFMVRTLLEEKADGFPADEKYEKSFLISAAAARPAVELSAGEDKYLADLTRDLKGIWPNQDQLILNNLIDLAETLFKENRADFDRLKLKYFFCLEKVAKACPRQTEAGLTALGNWFADLNGREINPNSLSSILLLAVIFGLPVKENAGKNVVISATGKEVEDVWRKLRSGAELGK